MSEMPPEPSPGATSGGARFLGMPPLVWVGVAALAAYFLFFRNSSGSGSAGTSQTGNVTISPGTTTIDVTETNQKSKHGTPNPQPHPKPKPRHKKTSVTFSNYTVKPGQTLSEIAKMFGISVAQLAHSNVYVAGESPGKKPGTRLGTGAGLKTGQHLRIPHYKTT